MVNSAGPHVGGAVLLMLTKACANNVSTNSIIADVLNNLIAFMLLPATRIWSFCSLFLISQNPGIDSYIKVASG